MKLTPQTKLFEMLKAYPVLEDILPTISPRFKAIKNPVMRNSIGRIATLDQVALMGGLTVEDLISRLEQAIAKPEAVSGKDGVAAILKELHSGVPLGEVKAKFGAMLSQISANEIAGIEQTLMKEGMAPEQIQELCGLHVEVFKEALAKNELPNVHAGHPVHTFMLENRELEKLVARVDDILKGEESSQTKILMDFLERIRAVDTHYHRKENQLFPVLESKGVTAPSKVMWGVDDDIRKMIKQERQCLKKADMKSFKAEWPALRHELVDMIYKEEHILFPMALEKISDAEWARMAEGEAEIGFAWIGKTATAKASPGPEPVISGNIPLKVGSLSPEMLGLVLTHLPVEISVVNDQDRVEYYSGHNERIFPRSPEVIGRLVQNCHPPKSVHIVMGIIDDFRQGKRDEAEFYIEHRGKFILIRYYAIRDENHAYRGTLEVTQDATNIRQLKGEKRLID